MLVGSFIDTSIYTLMKTSNSRYCPVCNVAVIGRVPSERCCTRFTRGVGTPMPMALGLQVEVTISTLIPRKVHVFAPDGGNQSSPFSQVKNLSKLQDSASCGGTAGCSLRVGELAGCGALRDPANLVLLFHSARRPLILPSCMSKKQKSSSLTLARHQHFQGSSFLDSTLWTYPGLCQLLYCSLSGNLPLPSAQWHSLHVVSKRGIVPR